MMLRLGIGYAVAFVTMVVMDAVWLPLVAAPMFRASLGDAILPGFRMVPAVLFYLIYAFGIVAFVIDGGRVASAWGALAFGAAFGLVAYATYDLTNYATLRPWTLRLVLADVGWGMVATALASALGWWAGMRLAPA